MGSPEFYLQSPGGKEALQDGWFAAHLKKCLSCQVINMIHCKTTQETGCESNVFWKP